MARRDLKDSRILITGASSGIGRDLARELARHGSRLLITARREERLQELTTELTAQGAEVHFLSGDITQPATRSALMEAAQAQLGGLDVLVNNAGVGSAERFDESTPEIARQVFELNFFSVVETTRLALPLLEQGNRPLIANIASVLGHVAVPKKSEYCASKFALHGFNDSLRAELKSKKIDVSLICPSTTSSEFWDSLLSKEATLSWKSLGMMTPEAVARATAKAIRRGRRELILTPGGKFLVWFDRMCPGVSGWLIARYG